MATVLGLCGFQGVGKSFIAEHLVDAQGWTRMSFASPLKDVVASVFGWPREWVEGRTPESRCWRETRDPWWSEQLGRDWTPRFALQFVGTEVFRSHLHTDIWIYSVMRTLQQLPDDARVVFDDVRFPNEIDALRQVGAAVVPVWRPSTMTPKLWDTHAMVNQQQEPPAHRSVWSWLLDEPLRLAVNRYLEGDTSAVIANEVDDPRVLWEVIEPWIGSTGVKG